MHESYAGYMHNQIHSYLRLQCDTEPLSRGIAKLSELVKVVRNSYTSSRAAEQLCKVAKEVVPSRMSLPDQAGIVAPEDFLKGRERKAFLSMTQNVPHDIEPPQPVKGCFRVNPNDLYQVHCKLLDAGVATIIPEHLGLRNSKGEIISGGLFAVDRKPHSDRIILDRRPFNELERRLVWAKLPHGSLLTQLIVPPGYSVRGSGDDLSNYFYLLKHQDSW